MIDIIVKIPNNTKPVYGISHLEHNGSSPFIRRNNNTGWVYNLEQTYTGTSRHPFNILTEEIYD